MLKEVIHEDWAVLVFRIFRFQVVLLKRVLLSSHYRNRDWNMDCRSGFLTHQRNFTSCQDICWIVDGLLFHFLLLTVVLWVEWLSVQRIYRLRLLLLLLIHVVVFNELGVISFRRVFNDILEHVSINNFSLLMKILRRTLITRWIICHRCLLYWHLVICIHGATTPWDSCVAMHLKWSHSLLRLVDRVHHVLVDLTVDEDMGPILIVEYRVISILLLSLVTQEIFMLLLRWLLIVLRVWMMSEIWTRSISLVVRCNAIDTHLTVIWKIQMPPRVNRITAVVLWRMFDVLIIGVLLLHIIIFEFWWWLTRKVLLVDVIVF